MSEAGNFDDHIKQEFRNYSPDVPSHIWERIVAEREKRRPGGFWFTLFNNKGMILLGVLILAGIVGGGLFVLHSSIYPNKINENRTSLTTGSEGVSSKGSSQVKVENNTNNNNSPTNNIQLSKSSPYKKEVHGNNVKTPKINNGDADALISQPVSGKMKLVVLQSENNYSATQSKKLNVGNKKPTSLYKKKYIISSNAIFSPDINSIVTIDQNQPSNTDTRNSDKSIKQYLENRFLSSVEKISLNTVNAELLSNQKNIPAINLPECPTIEKDAAANKRYFEAYIGPDYGIRTLTDTANTVYLEKRKESSKFTSGFSAGVRYTKVFTNGMSLRAALNYSQINEKFTFVQGSVVQITYIIDPNNGDTTGSYTVRGTRYKTTYNHYRSIDIPLTIGYEFGNGKLHTNINVGVVANIYSWQKGDVLDTNYQPVDITTGKGSSFYQFKTNVGLGATGGISLYYKINDQLHILAEPYMRYNFQPMSTSNLTLHQKYTTIGLRLGLRFDLPQ